MASQGKSSYEFFVWGLIALAAAIFVGFAAQWLQVAREFSLDYWDGMNFLLQARRLTDPAYHFVALDIWRPRALVALLSGFDIIFRTSTGKFPQIMHYHYLMGGVSVLFLLSSWVAIRRLWGDRAATLTVLLLVITEVFHHYAVMLLADILTGCLWMATVALFLGGSGVHQSRQEFSGEKVDGEVYFSLGRALLVGIVGAATGMGKYHFLLLAPLAMAYCFWVCPKNFLKPFLGFLLAYWLTLEIGFRVFSAWEAGIIGHARELFHQVQVALQLQRPPEIYVHGIYQMYGPLLLVMGFIGFVLVVVAFLHEKKRRVEFSLRNDFKSLCNRLSVGQQAIVISVAAHAALTQWITQREVRYLLPLLPVFLGTVSVIVIRAADGLSVTKKVVWFLLFVIALVHPWRRSQRDLNATVSSPLYVGTSAKWEKAWQYFFQEGNQERVCREIFACAHSLRLEPWEFSKDQFYRSFDLGPHYSFFTQLPVRLVTCPQFHKTQREISPSFTPFLPPEACFLFPFQSQSGDGLGLARPLSKSLAPDVSGAESAKVSRPQVPPVLCEGKWPHQSCWEVVDFFKPF